MKTKKTLLRKNERKISDIILSDEMMLEKPWSVAEAICEALEDAGFNEGRMKEYFKQLGKFM